jgi:hypothetical protein
MNSAVVFIAEQTINRKWIAHSKTIDRNINFHSEICDNNKNIVDNTLAATHAAASLPLQPPALLSFSRVSFCRLLLPLAVSFCHVSSLTG